MAVVYGWQLTLPGYLGYANYIAFDQLIVPDSQNPTSSAEVERMIQLSIQIGTVNYNNALNGNPAPNVNNQPVGTYTAILDFIQNVAVGQFGWRASTSQEFNNGITFKYFTPTQITLT